MCNSLRVYRSDSCFRFVLLQIRQREKTPVLSHSFRFFTIFPSHPFFTFSFTFISNFHLLCISFVALLPLVSFIFSVTFTFSFLILSLVFPFFTISFFICHCLTSPSSFSLAHSCSCSLSFSLSYYPSFSNFFSQYVFSPFSFALFLFCLFSFSCTLSFFTLTKPLSLFSFRFLFI